MKKLEIGYEQNLHEGPRYLAQPLRSDVTFLSLFDQTLPPSLKRTSFLNDLLIVGGSGSGKTSALVNLISHQLDIDKIYLYAKDLYEAKYQLLINKREGAGISNFNDSKAFVEYSNDMDDIYRKH